MPANSINSGSPFRQWRKAGEMARGDYVRTGEADDLADSVFVARPMEQMQAAGRPFGFTDCRQIDEHRDAPGDSYRP